MGTRTSRPAGKVDTGALEINKRKPLPGAEKIYKNP